MFRLSVLILSHTTLLERLNTQQRHERIERGTFYRTSRILLTRSRKTYKQSWAATDPNKPTPSPTPRSQRSQRVSQVESVVVIGIFGHRCLVLTTIRGRNQQRLSKQDRRRTNIYRKNKARC